MEALLLWHKRTATNSWRHVYKLLFSTTYSNTLQSWRLWHHVSSARVSPEENSIAYLDCSVLNQSETRMSMIDFFCILLIDMFILFVCLFVYLFISLFNCTVQRTAMSKTGADCCSNVSSQTGQTKDWLTYFTDITWHFLSFLLFKYLHWQVHILFIFLMQHHSDMQVHPSGVTPVHPWSLLGLIRSH